MTTTPLSHLLFAYDPGGTTGWAAFSVVPSKMWSQLIAYGEVDVWRGIETHINHPETMSVVYENLVPRSMSFNPIGIECIGVIKFLCSQKGIPAVLQPNSVIHGIGRWGTYDKLWKKIKSQHSKDAIAHGIVYLRKAGYTVTVE